ncbi:MAG: adenylate/guanylate cyclase domain-containing protein, partial [Gemmatimonadota bacterium]|nr:adenylate/guanylate cyclase domain-containing protein [Gemmatimonadota bacterium]
MYHRNDGIITLKVSGRKMAEKKNEKETRTAYVLYTDIVGFTLIEKLEQKRKTKERFKKLYLACADVKKRTRGKEYLFLDTGDGFAAAFLDSPEPALLSALEFSRKLKEAEIPCRMGLNLGLVYLVEDMNEQTNIIGGGVDYAQRVMDLGESGHILASKIFRDFLSQVKYEYEDSFHYLGPRRVKHGEVIEVYNACNDQAGNRDDPRKGRILGDSRRLSGPDDPLLAPEAGRNILGRESDIDKVISFLEGD